jgi:hypothetical protein
MATTEYENILKQIQKENMNIAIPEVPAKVLDADEERAASMDKRLDTLETGVTEMARLLSVLVHGVHANQNTPQTFAAPAAVPMAPPQIAILPERLTRVFPFPVGKEGKKSMSAHIAIKPIPDTTSTWHNPTLFSPGNIEYLYTEYTANPAEFAKNLVEAYQASIPYKYKKK